MCQKKEGKRKGTKRKKTCRVWKFFPDGLYTGGGTKKKKKKKKKKNKKKKKKKRGVCKM